MVVATPGMGKREANKLQTRRAILEAARSLAAERGVFPGLDEVAARAGVARATFFNYFASKDELVTALFAQRMERLSERVDDLLTRDLSTGERIQALFSTFTREKGRHAGFYFSLLAEAERYIHNAAAVPERHRIFQAELLRILEAGLPRGEVRGDLRPQFLAEMIAALYLAVIKNHRDADDAVLAERFEETALFVVGAIAPDSTPGAR